MPKAISKISRSLWFFLFALTFFIFSVSRLPQVGADSEASIEKYDRDHTTLREAVVAYHKNMNTLFNEHLELMLSGKGDLNPPGENEECSDKNVSTYCLSLRAVEEYQAFLEAMKTHRGYYDNPVTEEKSSSLDVKQQLDLYNQRDNLIDGQIVLAQKVLDVTLATYNELQIFYPLHVEYTELIKHLEKYRDGLAEIRREVEKYPDTFHNVSTTQCT